MLKNNKKVSVVIPTTGRLSLLQQALQSLVQQTYVLWEAIIVVDSHDEAVFERISSVTVGDPRLHVEMRSGAYSGAPNCRNQGAERARGDYLVFLDDDDYLGSDCLQKRVVLMDGHPELDFAVSPCQLFNETPGDVPYLLNVRTDQNDLDRFLSLDVPWQTASVIWRRNAFDALGGWSDGLPSFQDWDLHLRALASGLRYRWSGITSDCFWRLPQQSAETVGVKSASARHLKSHFELFLSMAELLVEADLLNENRRSMIAGLFFWIAEAWLKLGQREEALLVWEGCNRDGWLTQKQYSEGKRMLCSPVRILLRRVLRKFFLRGYPADFCAGDYSRTIRRCRADAGKEYFRGKVEL